MGDCIVDTTDGVMVIRFNRPERMNSMGGTMPRSGCFQRTSASAPMIWPVTSDTLG